METEILKAAFIFTKGFNRRREYFANRLQDLPLPQSRQLCEMIRYNLLFPNHLPFPEIQAAILYFAPSLSITLEQLNHPLLVLNLIFESLSDFSHRTPYNEITRIINVSSRRIVCINMRKFFRWLAGDNETIQHFHDRINDLYRLEISQLHEPTYEEKRGSLVGIHHILTELYVARDARITQLQQQNQLAYIAMVSYFNLVIGFRDKPIGDIIKELSISTREYDFLILQALQFFDLQYDGDLGINSQ